MGRYDSLKVTPGQRAASAWANAVIEALNELYDLASPAVKVARVTRVATDYNASPYEVVLADASAKAITVTLPAVAGGITVVVKKVDVTGNGVTVAPPTGKTVDGASTLTLTTPMQAVWLVADADGNWWVLARA